MDSYTTLIFLHQSRVSYTISYTKQSARRRSNAHVYVLLVPRDPLQGSRLRRMTTCHGSTLNGEGGIRTHEGVTPTRFRVVRDQPDSATSPDAFRRMSTLKVDEPRASRMLQKPTPL